MLGRFAYASDLLEFRFVLCNVSVQLLECVLNRNRVLLRVWVIPPRLHVCSNVKKNEAEKNSVESRLTHVNQLASHVYP